MEILTFFAFLIIILVLIITQSNMSGKIADLTRMVEGLRRQIHQMGTPKKEGQEVPEPRQASPGTAPKPAYTEPVRPISPPVEPPKPAVPSPETAAPVIPVPEVPKETPVEKVVPPVAPPVVPEVPKVAAEAVRPVIPAPKPVEAKPAEPKIAEPKIIAQPKLSFFERNPDLEKFIGENLINKIGIAILVLGIAFFVRYAISKEWIGPIGRAAIGVLCGGILIAFAHRLRKSFAAFSSVLVGGGLAVLYFTITISFHDYHLFTQPVAFAIMVLITGFSVLLSVSYNRVELAILALIGGFTSPFLLSTGEGNYIVLFTYVAILNSGILALAFFKKWNILNILSYGFTILLYTGWFISKVIWAKHAPYTGALCFVTLFYVQFFLTFIINNVLQSRKFNGLEIGLLLSNTFLYFAAGIYLLYHVEGGKYNGLFTLLVALINCIFAFALYKNQKVDKNLVYVLIGLVLTFVSLAAPIQLHGNQITMFWAAEAALLLWLSQKSGITLMKYGSLLVLMLMFGSLIMDWEKIYFPHGGKNWLLPAFVNKGFVTGLVAVLSLFVSRLLLKKDDESHLFVDFTVRNYRNVLGIVSLLVLYVVLFLEIHHQLHAHIHYFATIDLMLGSFNFLYLLFLLFMASRSSIKQFAETMVGLTLLLLISYPMFYHHMAVKARNFYLVKHGEINGYMYHYVLLLLMVVLLFFCHRILRPKPYFKQGVETILMIYMSLMLIFLSSAELDHSVVFLSDPAHIASTLTQNHKIGFPILWGICSFALIFLGMRYKKRELRIISLSLFLVIILKLFIFDLRGMSEGGKIASFIFLGVVLLVVSFMYQKLKKLVLDDDSKTEVE